MLRRAVLDLRVMHLRAENQQHADIVVPSDGANTIQVIGQVTTIMRCDAPAIEFLAKSAAARF
jgi:hypothetical protein